MAGVETTREYFYGTYSGFKLKELGRWTDVKEEYNKPIDLTVEIIDNVLYIFKDEKLIWTAFKL